MKVRKHFENFKRCLALFLIASPLCVWSNDGEFISAQTQEGTYMSFRITSERELTVKVGQDFHDLPSISTSTTGTITIPSFVTHNGKKYSVTCIGSGAFQGCSKLTSVYIPSSVTSIERAAFRSCQSLTSIDIPNSVKSIGSCAFESCAQLSYILIPDSLSDIGMQAFDNTPWYQNQPDGIIYVGLCAYKYKGTMPDGTSITIKEGITSISPFAFYECVGLTKLIIANTVTTIGGSAFTRCKKLTSVCIPNSVKRIDDAAFSGCSLLTMVTLNSDIIYDMYLKFGEQVTSYILGDSVTTIGNQAFQKCTNLTFLSVGNSVTNIGPYTFYNCSKLSSLYIGKSVKSIGEKAFYYCNQLNDIYSISSFPPIIASDTFSSYNATLHVPLGCVSEYKSADYWQLFPIVEDNTMSINTQLYNDEKGMAIYDLHGREVQTIHRGIYIHKGKKVFFKEQIQF